MTGDLIPLVVGLCGWREARPGEEVYRLVGDGFHASWMTEDNLAHVAGDEVGPDDDVEVESAILRPAVVEPDHWPDPPGPEDQFNPPCDHAFTPGLIGGPCSRCGVRAFVGGPRLPEAPRPAPAAAPSPLDLDLIRRTLRDRFHDEWNINQGAHDRLRIKGPEWLEAALDRIDELEAEVQRGCEEGVVLATECGEGNGRIAERAAIVAWLREQELACGYENVSAEPLADRIAAAAHVAGAD